MRLGLCVNHMEKKFFLKQAIELVPFRLQFPAFLPQGLFFNINVLFKVIIVVWLRSGCASHRVHATCAVIY